MTVSGKGRGSSSVSRSIGPTILLIEDDPSLLATLLASLEARDFNVSSAVKGVDGLRQASIDEPDLVILDLGLPDIDGLEVCRQLRRWTRNPIIVLTADGAEERKVTALEDGADDYVTKPFGMPELMARIGVALRHRQLLAAVADDRVLRLASLVIDIGAHEVTLDGVPMVLTPKEFSLLVLLARNAGRVLTHDAILDQVWGSRQGLATLRIHVNQLRNKLATSPEGPSLETAPGIGYRLVAAGEAEQG